MKYKKYVIKSVDPVKTVKQVKLVKLSETKPEIKPEIKIDNRDKSKYYISKSGSIKY